MNLIIEQAAPNQAAEVSEILQEAANWLVEKGEKLWEVDELAPEKIKTEVEAGMFWLARIEGETAGCVRFQTEDLEYWDDVPHSDSAFVHRVAVKRKFAGKGVAAAMLDWAKNRAESSGKTYLRLDCGKREKLCRFYESQGFTFHSEKVREPYSVVRYEYKFENR
ncbi:MAG: GNAT family N-acetyltransferase [Pyrinomonadaceae bacterium]|nr:GNAT family N-acetyltransferase [Pyrinomonadaceae bacterium]